MGSQRHLQQNDLPGWMREMERRVRDLERAPALRNTSRLAEVLARLHSTSGGVNDTELKLFAVSPIGVPSAVRVVMIVTPVANVPSALRNSVGSKTWAVIDTPVASHIRITSAKNACAAEEAGRAGYDNDQKLYLTLSVA